MTRLTAKDKTRALLRDAIISLCRQTLPHKEDISVEGLLGITIDHKDVFLVNIHESIGGRSTSRRKRPPPTVATTFDESPSNTSGLTVKNVEGNTSYYFAAGAEGPSSGLEQKQKSQNTPSKSPAGSLVTSKRYVLSNGTPVGVIRDDGVVVTGNWWPGSKQSDSLKSPQTVTVGGEVVEIKQENIDSDTEHQEEREGSPVIDPGDWQLCVDKQQTEEETTDLGRRGPQIRLHEFSVDCGDHRPHLIPPTARRSHPQKRCRVCYKQGLRKESRYCCPVCPGYPGLCVVPCFELYHSDHSYQSQVNQGFSFSQLDAASTSETSVAELTKALGLARRATSQVILRQDSIGRRTIVGTYPSDSSQAIVEEAEFGEGKYLEETTEGAVIETEYVGPDGDEQQLVIGDVKQLYDDEEEEDEEEEGEGEEEGKGRDKESENGNDKEQDSMSDRSGSSSDVDVDDVGEVSSTSDVNKDIEKDTELDEETKASHKRKRKESCVQGEEEEEEEAAGYTALVQIKKEPGLEEQEKDTPVKKEVEEEVSYEEKLEEAEPDVKKPRRSARCTALAARNSPAGKPIRSEKKSAMPYAVISPPYVPQIAAMRRSGTKQAQSGAAAAVASTRAQVMTPPSGSSSLAVKKPAGCVQNIPSSVSPSSKSSKPTVITLPPGLLLNSGSDQPTTIRLPSSVTAGAKTYVLTKSSSGEIRKTPIILKTVAMSKPTSGAVSTVQTVASSMSSLTHEVSAGSSLPASGVTKVIQVSKIPTSTTTSITTSGGAGSIRLVPITPKTDQSSTSSCDLDVPDNYTVNLVPTPSTLNTQVLKVLVGKPGIQAADADDSEVQ